MMRKNGGEWLRDWELHVVRCAEVSALVDLPDNIVRSSEFSREIDKIWSEITSIRDRFGFLEKHWEDDVKNVQLINTLRQKNQDAEIKITRRNKQTEEDLRGARFV